LDGKIQTKCFFTFERDECGFLEINGDLKVLPTQYILTKSLLGLVFPCIKI